MASNIKIETLITRSSYLLLGLSVQSNETFPLVVGCSLQNGDGEIFDIPARWILSEGIALWGQERVDIRFMYPKEIAPYTLCTGWEGNIIFALYSDSTFNNRLADTGWIKWESRNLIGSSLAGEEYEDPKLEAIINSQYLDRKKNIWGSLEDCRPIDIWKPFLK